MTLPIYDNKTKFKIHLFKKSKQTEKPQLWSDKKLWVLQITA